MTVAAIQPRPRLAVGLALAIIGVGLAGFIPADKSELGSTLTLLLIAISIGSWLVAASFTGNTVISPAFLAPMLAVAFLGPAGAFVVPLAGEVGGWLVLRYRWRAALINVASTATPTLIAAWLFLWLDPDEPSALFYAAIAVATAFILVLNTTIVVPLMNLLDGHRPVMPEWSTEAELIPTILLSSALTIVVAAAYVEWGIPALGVAVLVIAVVAYMERLVGRSREQTRQYANLSWGVLSSLIRTLDERDKRAARHCAAVAKFSRDIAAHVGMGRREQELAHTAGLLHDIGRFALSDRVMEREGRLSEEDWAAIRRHP
ncbi:MAG TPA: HDOD domain-containing protein, partial [Casimicrobiaceae bacterium]